MPTADFGIDNPVTLPAGGGRRITLTDDGCIVPGVANMDEATPWEWCLVHREHDFRRRHPMRGDAIHQHASKYGAVGRVLFDRWGWRILRLNRGHQILRGIDVEWRLIVLPIDQPCRMCNRLHRTEHRPDGCAHRTGALAAVG